jgi:hypothetical protein
MPSSTLSDRLIQRQPSRPQASATSEGLVVGHVDLTDRSWRDVWAQRLARHQLAPLYHLQGNWDSFGGTTPAPAVLASAEALLGSLAAHGYPQPHLVPVGDGGITIEWTGDGYEFAITLSAASDQPRVVVYYYRASTGQEWESDNPSPDQLNAALTELQATQPY